MGHFRFLERDQKDNFSGRSLLYEIFMLAKAQSARADATPQTLLRLDLCGARVIISTFIPFLCSAPTANKGVSYCKMLWWFLQRRHLSVGNKQYTIDTEGNAKLPQIALYSHTLCKHGFMFRASQIQQCLHEIHSVFSSFMLNNGFLQIKYFSCLARIKH